MIPALNHRIVVNRNYVWDPGGLTWVAEEEAGAGPGGGLTDAELRATPVPVSGTVTANAGTNLNTSALALEAGGNLASVKTNTDKIPAQGQALAAASMPVVLTAAQVTTLTPPAAITGFALEATLGTRLAEATFDTKVGSLTEAAPANDTASSGLNGRLQRIAQRLTSLIALVPSALSNGFFQVSLKETITVPVSVAAAITANPATAGGKTITYVAVAQGAAGTTVLAAADAAKKHKILGAALTMSAAGTLKFNDGTVDLSGAMDIAASGGFVLPSGFVPYAETAAVNRPLNLVTTVGLAKGMVAVLTEA